MEEHGVFPRHIKSFDSELWLKYEHKRSVFLKYLVKTNMIFGKTKDEVKQLLGQEGNYIPFDRWTYFIGKGIFGSRYLVVYFKEEKVKGVKIEWFK